MSQLCSKLQHPAPRNSRTSAILASMTSATPAASATLLAARDLHIAFSGHEAVHGISFEIAPGETVGLVGESGSGKSATSLALLRLLPPRARVSGNILFAGEELLSLSTETMRRHR